MPHADRGPQTAKPLLIIRPSKRFGQAKANKRQEVTTISFGPEIIEQFKSSHHQRISKNRYISEQRNTHKTPSPPLKKKIEVAAVACRSDAGGRGVGGAGRVG